MRKRSDVASDLGSRRGFLRTCPPTSFWRAVPSQEPNSTVVDRPRWEEPVAGLSKYVLRQAPDIASYSR